ncbi:MAG TPA: alpha/beta fold hydrolase, partial [Vicinamibacteria bacterium]|nr:alpha/beta fold hydrolase [Vicinamibacteria bacterium]
FWGEAKSIHWECDGLRVQGWLIPPKEIAPGRRYPLVVVVHGGPSAAATPRWPTQWTAILPSQGYFVFLPNPRGSYGQGEAFTQANVKDFGYGDFRDILAGVDAVLKSEPIDPGRLGITGWSYGGYMTMWAVTQTRRFAAAVAGAGIVDWQSYYGQNRIDRWLIPFFGASVYDDPWIYARSSPISYIKGVATPTLVLHGDRDSEVPTPQGYEFWHALKALGVPTELVIYEGEGHAIRSRAHQGDIMKRSVEWFDKYLAAGPR